MTKRESRLITSFAFILLIAAALIVANFFMRKHKELIHKQLELERNANLAKRAPELHQLLLPEKEWIEKFEPTVESYSKATSDFQKFVTESAKKASLTLITEKVNIVEADSSPYRRVQMVVSFKNSPSMLTDWMVTLHNPEQFRAVTAMKIIPDAKNLENILAQLVIEKWLVEEESE